MLELLALAVIALPQSSDTATYADSATAELLEQARMRHDYQDQLVRDYAALVRTRIDVAFGRSRFARMLPIAAHETAARIVWALPNDLKVDVIGARYVSAFENADVEAAFDRPWFIPRSLGDSIRLVDDELPTTAALHPLAHDAEQYYKYAIVDSLTMSIPGRTVRAVAVRVEPKELAPSLIAGDLWLDTATAEVVRMTFVFVGEYLWELPNGETARDSTKARKDNVWAARIVKMEADLEYALFEARYWMPYRQMIQLSIHLPWIIDVAIPIRFITTFDDYEVNQSVFPGFEAAPFALDSIEEGEDEEDVRAGDRRRRQLRRRAQSRCPGGEEDCDRDSTGYFRVGNWAGDGRWEVHYPPKDSLVGYEWPDELSLALSPEDEDRIHDAIGQLGEISEQLPSDWVGRMPMGVAFRRFSDIYRFNRVEGSAVGLGYQFKPGPAFTTLLGQGRYGFSDKRVTGSLTWIRDAPAGRLEIAAFRTAREVEPWTGGLGFGNSMNALFTVHDDADYYLASYGGGVTYNSNAAGFLREGEIGLYYERQDSMPTVATTAINDALGGSGTFQPNPQIAAGHYLRGTFSRASHVGQATFRQGLDALKSLDSAGFSARVWATGEVPYRVWQRRGAFTVRTGLLVADELPQMLFRVGGPQTVRGHTYGVKKGAVFWSAQLDFALTGNSAIAPVVFVDVGDAYEAPAGANPVSVDGPLVGVGAGVSFLQGFMRLNFAWGVNPGDEFRFDLLFRAPR